MYYPHFLDLSGEQRAYYIYWRQEYERGHTLPADATYRFLYAYELATQSESAVDLEDAWLRLRTACRKGDAFSQTMANWITDLRLQQGRIVYDAITEALGDARFALDLAIAAQTPPHASLLLPLYSKHSLLPASAYDSGPYHSFIGSIDTSPVIAFAENVTPTALRRELFGNIGATRSALERFGPLHTTILSYKRSSAVQNAIDAIVEAMFEIVGQAIPNREVMLSADPTVMLVASVPRNDPGRAAIVRTAVAALPEALTLEGAVWTIESVLGAEPLLLLLLVLWLSESKPYIEGRIAFSHGLRKYYEAVGDRITMHATIGTMRRAFWTLSRGARALWTLDPMPLQPADIKTSVTGARFQKKLQHVFAGSAPRAQAIAKIGAQLARRTHTPKSRIFEVVTAATGTSPSMRVE